MEEIKRFPVCDGVNFNYICQSRFKTGRISIAMFLPLEKDSASCNAILPFLLVRTCNKYPDFTSLNKKLSGLYGATLNADVSRVGEAQVLSISANFLDNRYSLYNENISSEITDLLCEVLFYPKLSGESFYTEDFEQERRQLAEQIDSEYNNKKLYALIRCWELMCKNERFSVNPLGNKNSVLNLNPEIIYKTWKNLLKSAQIEITMISSSSPESAVSGFKKAFLNIKRENIINFKTEFIKSAEKIQEIEEKQDIKQAKLVMGFRAGVSVEDKKDFFASHLMTALFGGTAHSKLFLNVREKLSLCYYCSASYIRRKGLIMVQSGIEKENIQKAQKEILNQLEEIKQGSFTDQELNAAKMSLKNSFISLSDSLASLENFYTSQSFDKEKYSPELYAKEIEKVTGDQVIKAANAVSLDTVYSLVN